MLSETEQRCLQALFGPTPAPMRLARQSGALQIHNGDTVSEDRGGEGEQTVHKSFTNNLSEGIQQDRSDRDTRLTHSTGVRPGSSLWSIVGEEWQAGETETREETSALGYRASSRVWGLLSEVWFIYLTERNRISACIFRWLIHAT